MDAESRAERNALLIRLETELLGSTTRRDEARLRALLHPDFVEIGRSGRRFEREEVVGALLAEGVREAPAASEWCFVELGGALVLVTYRLDRGRGAGGGDCAADGASRHASVWDTSADPPVLRYHQGTRIASD